MTLFHARLLVTAGRKIVRQMKRFRINLEFHTSEVIQNVSNRLHHFDAMRTGATAFVFPRVVQVTRPVSIAFVNLVRT